MKHSRSSAEWEIRDAVVARFRELWPNARIIHEMNVEHGSSRADVVAVQPERLWICEIKSERDKLDRLAGQIKDFGPACHGLIIAAHEKWTRREQVVVPERITRSGLRTGGYMTEGESLLDKAAGNTSRYETWTFPEPEQRYVRDWSAPYEHRVPWYHRMLLLLWSDELRIVAATHGISGTSRTPGYKLARELSAQLSGREIERAVCKMLRLRSFTEADAPIEVAA